MSITLISLLLPVVVTGVLLGLSYIKTKLADVKNERLRDALYQLTDTVRDTVNAANQTIVAEVKKSPKAKLNKDEASAIKDVVVTQVLATLSADAQKILQKEFSNLDLKVGNLVESSVWRNKN